ncbi:MAG: hypothetical protein FWE31_05080, partial [Firmicutes bacterium]|nr:hypothetical protein [Bacillota bacterium]
GWDDPRMPTISGMRRRGYPPQAIMDFVTSTGVSKTPTTVPLSALEYYVRTHLDKTAPRISIVFNPLKIKIGKREFWIEQDDFSESPPEGWKRLTVGGVVRLREFMNIKCVKVHKDYLECVETDENHSGIIHWVDAKDAIEITVNEFEPLLFKGTALVEENINKDSKRVSKAFASPEILNIDGNFQAVRKGFYIKEDERVINKTVGLKERF